MSVSYNRLWKQLIDKNMKRIEMQHLTGISANILARMGKNQYVSMETVEKICKKMDCTIDEMMEFKIASRIRHNSLSKAKSALLYRQLHLPVSCDLRCHS